MATYGPVSAAIVPVGTQAQNDVVTVPQSETPELALVTFLKDHFVYGGFLGGKVAYKTSRIVQGSADQTKNQLVASLPNVARHLQELPNTLRALLSDDPFTMARVEENLNDISSDLAAAASTGVMLGLARLMQAALPFAVAAGYVVGAAVGEGRLQTLVSYARETLKED